MKRAQNWLGWVIQYWQKAINFHFSKAASAKCRMLNTPYNLILGTRIDLQLRSDSSYPISDNVWFPTKLRRLNNSNKNFFQVQNTKQIITDNPVFHNHVQQLVMREQGQTKNFSQRIPEISQVLTQKPEKFQRTKTCVTFYFAGNI